jgi:hypothetical protein
MPSLHNFPYQEFEGEGVKPEYTGYDDGSNPEPDYSCNQVFKCLEKAIHLPFYLFMRPNGQYSFMAL